jgi:hypothetical protein
VHRSETCRWPWPPAAGDRVSRATRRDTRADTARRCGSLGRLEPRAILRLMELAALDRVDEQGNLIPLQQLPEVDRRVIAVAANSLLDRAFGKPKPLLSEAEQEDSP